MPALPSLNAIKCYICGPYAYESFGGQLNSTQFKSCDGYSVNKSTEFIMECPSKYVGCITQINGTQTTRTCETLDLNDCQTANGVKYCYCSLDLCNGGFDASQSIVNARDLPHVHLTPSNDIENVESAKGDEKLQFSIKSIDVQNQSNGNMISVCNVLFAIIAFSCSRIL